MAYGATLTLPTISGSHTDLPVLLKTNDFPVTSIDGSTNAIDNGGGNLVIYIDDTKTTQLAIEVVTFVSSGTPEAEVWVKIPTVATGNTIYIEADDTQTSQPAATATYGRNAVWSDYIAVYHMNQDPSGSAPQMVDSTGNGYDATSSGAMTSGDLVAGQIGDSLEFDGIDDYIDSGGTPAASIGAGDYTRQMWLDYTTAAFDVIETLSGEFISTNAGIVQTGGAATTTAVNDGSPHQVTITRSGTTTQAYMDGVAEGSGTDSAFIGGAIRLGAYTSGGFEFAGIIDEYRLLDIARSNNFIATEYSNQNASVAWVTVGTWADSGGSQDINLGLQTDSETQLGLSVTTSINVSLGLISDNETQLSLTPQASNDVSLAILTDSESLLALSPSTSIDVTLGILTDSETLLALSTGGEINQSIGILDDSEALLGITPSTSVDVSLGLLTDSEALLSFTPSQATNVTIGIIDDSESLLGLVVTGSINIQMGLITDSEALLAMVQPSYNPLKYIGVHAILDTTTNYYGAEIL